LLATAYYGLRILDAERASRLLAPVYWLLRNKWWFDEIYHCVFVRPVLWIAGCVANVDKKGIDWLADGSARLIRALSKWENWIDRRFDRLIDLAADGTYDVGLGLRRLQTGSLRQYVMLIAVGTVALFVLISLY